MILHEKAAIAHYLQVDGDTVDIFIESGLPMTEPVLHFGLFTTDRLVDEWIENHYRSGREPAKEESIKHVSINTTDNPVEDLRTVVKRLLGDGYKDQEELLSSLEYAVELLEGRHPERFNPLKDMKGA